MIERARWHRLYGNIPVERMSVGVHSAFFHRGIAQLVEYRSPKPWVAGSNPPAPAITEAKRLRFFFYLVFLRVFLSGMHFLTNFQVDFLWTQEYHRSVSSKA